MRRVSKGHIQGFFPSISLVTEGQQYSPTGFPYLARKKQRNVCVPLPVFFAFPLDNPKGPRNCRGIVMRQLECLLSWYRFSSQSLSEGSLCVSTALETPMDFMGFLIRLEMSNGLLEYYYHLAKEVIRIIQIPQFEEPLYREAKPLYNLLP